MRAATTLLPLRHLAGRCCAAAVLAWALPVAAQGRCADDPLPSQASAAALVATGDAPRQQLQALVQAGLARSQAVGAARLLSDAAALDVDETRAAAAVQASLGGNLGPTHSEASGLSRSAALQGQATLSASQLLWDGGRNEGLVDWRRLLSQAAQQSELNVKEQLALSTVVLALERNRYRLQVQVFDQYAGKMACLVSALQDTVAADRGRASELVQARKTLQQVELQRADVQAQLRQVEVRLRRLVGEQPLVVDGLLPQLQPVPALPELLAGAARANEIAQLDAQAAALSRYADAVKAGNRPTLSWVLSGARSGAAGGSLSEVRGGSVTLGLAINVPLLNPGVEPASEAARRRAGAAQAQRDDALDARQYRIRELHEQARATLERVERVSGVLQSSEQLRNATLQQWQQLGRRSLFDVIGAESEHYGLRLTYVNALHDTQQLNANLLALGFGIEPWLRQP